MPKCQVQHQSGEKREPKTGMRAVAEAMQSLAARWTEPQPPTAGPSDPGKSNVVLLPFLQEPVTFFLIPFFLIELGSEMFSRKLFMCPYFKGTLLCERNEGREKVNIKTNLT